MMQIPPVPIPVSNVDNSILLTMVVQFISQLKANGLTSGAIQVMKSSKWPIFSWINADTPTAARILGFVAASATSVGMHWTYHNGTLMITGLTLYAIIHLVFDIAQNYLMQHAWYKIIFQSMFPASPAPVQAKP
jgi:hypothetical protein